VFYLLKCPTTKLCIFPGLIWRSAS